MDLSLALDALAAAVAERVAAHLRHEHPPATPPAPPSWRERLWTCDPLTRLGVTELCEATGKPKSWIYAHTKTHCKCPPLPHRRLDGSLVFLAGELRQWITEHERLIVFGRVAPLVIERKPKGAA